MVDKKITELTAITGAELDVSDEIVVVDISADETKAATRSEFFGNTPPITVTGTVTSTGLVVSSDGKLNNITFGRGAGGSLTNTASGYNALQSNTTGTFNTANGYTSLSANTTGTFNTSVGYEAMRNNTIGERNTAIGFQSLLNNSEGIYNSAIGYYSLLNNTTGDNNIGLGYDSGRATSPFNITTEDNRIVIGNNSHTNAYIKVAWTVTSDARDKTEFMPLSHGLDFVNLLQPTEYQFKVGSREGVADGIRRYGFLAQDVLEIEGPNSVIVDQENPDSLKLRESHLIPILVNAIKELSDKVDQLDAEVTVLKGL